MIRRQNKMTPCAALEQSDNQSVQLDTLEDAMANDINNNLNGVRMGDLPYFEEAHQAQRQYGSAPQMPPVQPQVKQESVGQTPPTVRFSGGNGDFIVFQPYTPEDIIMIINNLKAKQTVLVKLNSQERHDAQRMLDMLSGATFALGGSMAEVEQNIYAIAPLGIQIVGQPR